jgi:ribosomal protein L11 methyltransferase
MYQLVLRAPMELVEPLSDALVDDLGALSVSVEDADAGTADEHVLFGEPDTPVEADAWPRSTLSALFATESQCRDAAAWLLGQELGERVHVLPAQQLPEQDWVRLTQSLFEPVPISPGFWVVPSWHDTPAGATHVIRLDPGLAFGTGTHPTTRMCLRWLARQAPALPGLRVLDYGCGSGILAIAAALHGATVIDALDIDPAAVQATRANASSNGVVLTAGLPDRAAGRYQVVLANILAAPLKLLAPLLSGHLAGGGALVLAGILERQTVELQQAYAPWLALQVEDSQDGWVLLTGRAAAGR